MKRPHLKLSVMMFIEWFIWGAWFVPLWQYLNQLGFTPGEIAWSYSSTAIAAILSPVLIGVIADRYSGYIYVDKKAPPHMRTAAQGLITLICQGLGSFIGNWLGGRAMTTFALEQPRDGMTFDWFAVWGIGAVMVVGVMLLFLLFFRERSDNITPIDVARS